QIFLSLTLPPTQTHPKIPPRVLRRRILSAPHFLRPVGTSLNQRAAKIRSSQQNRGFEVTRRAAAPKKPAPRVRHKYKRNFLKQVIARLDFATNIGIPTSGPPKSVIDAVRKK